MFFFQKGGRKYMYALQGRIINSFGCAFTNQNIGQGYEGCKTFLALKLKTNIVGQENEKIMPPVRLELTAFRLWDWRAAYCATEAGESKAKIFIFPNLRFELNSVFKRLCSIYELCNLEIDLSSIFFCYFAELFKSSPWKIPIVSRRIFLPPVA